MSTDAIFAAIVTAVILVNIFGLFMLARAVYTGRYATRYADEKLGIETWGQRYQRFQFGNFHRVIHEFKDSMFHHFLPVTGIRLDVSINEEESDVFEQISRSAMAGARASLLSYMESRGIEIGNDIALNIKIIISSEALVEKFAGLSEFDRRQILQANKWAFEVYNDPPEEERNAKVYDISRNSAFYNLHDMLQPYFLSNNLRGLEEKYLNENPNWANQYNATLVVPISYIDDQVSTRLVFGFVSASSMNTGKSELFDTTCVEILSYAADVLATFFLFLTVSKYVTKESPKKDITKQIQVEQTNPVVNTAPVIVVTDMSPFFLKETFNKTGKVTIYNSN
jgi:hypothetical protein